MARIMIGAKMRARLAACLCWAGIVLISAPRAEDGADVKVKPLQFGALQEFGMIQKGLLVSQPVTEFEAEWVDRFGSYLIQEVVINDRLVLKGGLGGIFEWPKPEFPQEQFGGSQYKLFFIGPSDAEAMYHFGGVEDGIFSVGGGMFPFKYNPDAANLGEYLFRSGPYPGYLMTGGNGGLTAIGDQFSVLQGFRANAHSGNWNVDLLLTTETGLPPLYDWSLGLVGDYKIADGLLDIGAGAVMKRLIKIDKKRTDVKALENSYFQRNGVWYSGEARRYSQPAKFLQAQADVATAAGDTALASRYTRESVALKAIADSISLSSPLGGPWVNPNTKLVDGASYYTPAGTMLMARASMDFKKLFDSEIFSAQDLRLYAEMAILGVKDYPIYYEKITERMPFMVGFNVPTFKFLDLLAVQFEYYNSPNLNNTQTIGEKNWAIPFEPEGTDPIFSKTSYNDLTKKDNYAWSILAKKTVYKHLSFNAQVARDHMRTIGTNWFYGSRFEPAEVLHKTSSWYWMFQLGWNI